MKVYCRGASRIRHKTTGSICEVESDELEWDVAAIDERQKDV
jgi:hypothetical protein